MESHQLDLFSNSVIRAASARRPDELLMDADALLSWKAQIVTYQQKARASRLPQQPTLFDLAPKHSDPEAIDPFILAVHSMSFYRFPVDSPGDACIYFVIDSAANLIMYVGETCRSNLRWKGQHDCKRYIASYQELHYRHGLKSAVNIAFWWEAPVQTKQRQQLELSLIQKWRSPFNKENWTMWRTPFV